MKNVQGPTIFETFYDALSELRYRIRQYKPFLVLTLPAFWIGLFFLLPFLILFKISFSESVIGVPPFTDVLVKVKPYFYEIKLSFENFVNVFTNSLYRSALLSSFWVALCSTFVTLIVGYAIAYAISRAPKKWRPFLMLLILLPFWTSFLIRVYAWTSFLSSQGVLNNFLIFLGIVDEPILFVDNVYAVCLGISYCYLPFMVLPLCASLEKIEQDYIEASYDLGCSPFKTFWKVTVPLSKQGIITGCLLVFIPAMGEFVIPELLGGPDAVMIGRIIWMEFFNTHNWPQASALAVVMLFIFILPLIFFQKHQNKDS